MTPDHGTVADGGWTVVVPVKPLTAAKTRLAPLADADRVALALAMATDTIATAVECLEVSVVVVVTDDPTAADAAAHAGALVVADVPAAGLDAALVHGAEVAHRQQPGQGIAALAADLPAARADELAAALSAARADRCVLADTFGEGTVMLTARAAVELEPAFGEGSFRRHVASGAVPIDVDVPGLRRDVDTVADLTAALTLGCGPRTTAIAAALDEALRRTPTRFAATVSRFDSASRSGDLVLDDGTAVGFGAAVFDASGLQLLQSGQRVRIEVDDADTRSVTRLTIGPG
jgi:2-phospho-L-lactate/phosphoenolpyruvate guanylyltransferase